MNLRNSLLIIFILNFSSLFGQDLWKIEYEVYDKIFIDEADKELQQELNQNNSTPKYYALVFNAEQSFFSEIERIDNTQGKRNISMSTIDNNIYMDYSKNYYSIEGVYANKNILVKDDLPKYNWTIHRDKKEILGIKATKATTKINDSEIEAWFALDIKPKGGPVYFNGLPGLIIELNSNENLEGERYETTFRLIKIDKASKKDKIIIPSKGEIMTNAQKNEFVKEANRKMMEAYKNKVNKD